MLLAILLSLLVARPAAAQCTCSSGHIPIYVDVRIAANPANPHGLNSTLTRLNTTFSIFGVLCEPRRPSPAQHDAVQLLLHGQTYTTQYWDVAWNGFQNYSYVAYSCASGISSFAYDNIGAGRSTRPVNASDCQIPTAASVASSLARDLKSGHVSNILTGRIRSFAKVIGFGHSLGSATLNYAAIRDGAKSPFDGLVLTGHIHDPQFTVKSPVMRAPARDVDPVRWGKLDPAYITTPNLTARAVFFGPDKSTYSPTVLQLDEMTKDVGSLWISTQIKFTYVPAHNFSRPVVELVGALDEAHCLDNNAPCDRAALQKTEAVYWPNSRNFTMIVVDRSGHNVNLGLAAAKAFPVMKSLFENFVR